ncbi:hypothetical protein AAFN86_29085 [Roseomonas sp. CAU 1739]|uniref:hypothetical protein n=1 Tax=Roseomonas sp. CAU 1739 TaxID=3140364 RepID=UPI00325A80AE
MTDETYPLTDDQRRMARVMAGMGVARRQIAKYLRMDEAALATRLGDDLEQAEVEANTKVAKALFTMATQKNNVAAAIFWMKARAGWREKIEIRPVVENDLSYLTDAELAAEIARIEREIRGAGGVLEGPALDRDDDRVASRIPRGG